MLLGDALESRQGNGEGEVVVIIKRAASSEALDSTRGLWWPIDVGGRTSAIVSCPGCDRRWSLERWTIDADGSVHPSVNHSVVMRMCDGSEIQDCSFHEFIRLEGWAS